VKRTVLSPPMTTRQRQKASSALWHLVKLGALAIAPLLVAPAQAHMRGMYATKAEAEKRAAELNCKGTFAMGTMWMPCANERALHDALQKAQ
jgi:hypothetical protein